MSKHRDRIHKFDDALDAWEQIKAHQDFHKLAPHARLPSEVLALAEKHGIHLENVLKGWQIGHRFFQIITGHLEAIRQHQEELDSVEQAGGGAMTPLQKLLRSMIGARARDVSQAVLDRLQAKGMDKADSILARISEQKGNVLEALQTVGFSITAPVSAHMLRLREKDQNLSWMQLWAEGVYALSQNGAAVSPVPPPPVPRPLPEEGVRRVPETTVVDHAAVFAAIQEQIDAGVETIEIDSQRAWAIWVTMTDQPVYQKLFKYSSPTRFLTVVEEAGSAEAICQARGVKDADFVAFLVRFLPAISAFPKEINRLQVMAQQAVEPITWEKIKASPFLAKLVPDNTDNEAHVLKVIKDLLPAHGNSVGKLCKARGIVNGYFIMNLMGYLRHRGVAIEGFRQRRTKPFVLAIARPPAPPPAPPASPPPVQPEPPRPLASGVLAQNLRVQAVLGRFAETAAYLVGRDRQTFIHIRDHGQESQDPQVRALSDLLKAFENVVG